MKHLHKMRHTSNNPGNISSYNALNPSYLEGFFNLIILVYFCF